ncbi:MAG: hypothetical protein FP823_17475 [Rhodoferax sp.]|nr:hypothetical protein [Rhodoferax sp.]
MGVPPSNNRISLSNFDYYEPIPIPIPIEIKRTMTNTHASDRNPWSVFLIFLRLGLSSLGGPIAHLGYGHPCRADVVQAPALPGGHHGRSGGLVAGCHSVRLWQ